MYYMVRVELSQIQEGAERLEPLETWKQGLRGAYI